MIDHLLPEIQQRLVRWIDSTTADWYAIDPQTGYYGSGYNNWGVQTVQKHCAALLTAAATLPEGTQRQTLQQRGYAELRYNLNTHLSGSQLLSDGTRWGHTWISPLGLERMFFALEPLRNQLPDDLQQSLKRVVLSEADWIYHHYTRGKHTGVVGDPWGDSGMNAPESNLWTGSLLWRACEYYPQDAPAEWRERAHTFLINAVSIAADATDATLLAGKPIRDRFRGANFFPHFGLDHHAYLNVGYMVICLSNAAFLHFDARLGGYPAPATLYHHQRELWQLTRSLIFDDGRLCRIGGDSRVRYGYCQEYLLPTLLYAADAFDDREALQLIDPILQWLGKEQDHNQDGSFFSSRLQTIRQSNPYYWTRLESDRGVALAMTLAYSRLLDTGQPTVTAANETNDNPASPVTLTTPTADGHPWIEPELGAVVHRSAQRIASYCWRSHGFAQGMCLPPADGHLAEWFLNLSPYIRLIGDSGQYQGIEGHQRSIQLHHIEGFVGGFATIGRIIEGTHLFIAEGWQAKNGASSEIAIAALPDGQTMIGLHRTRANPDRRSWFSRIQGLNLHIPNDLFNDDRRTLHTAIGSHQLTAPAARDSLQSLHSAWANIDDRIGIVSLDNQSPLHLQRQTRRSASPTPLLSSLYLDTFCLQPRNEPLFSNAGQTVLDCGWMVISNASASATAAAAAQHASVRQPHPDADIFRIRGMDNQSYLFIANFSEEPLALTTTELNLDHQPEPIPGWSGPCWQNDQLLLPVNRCSLSMVR